jgi:hypothetical protein
MENKGACFPPGKPPIQDFQGLEERKSIRILKNAEEASAMLKKKSKSIEVDEKKVKRVQKK